MLPHSLLLILILRLTELPQEDGGNDIRLETKKPRTQHGLPPGFECLQISRQFSMELNVPATNHTLRPDLVLCTCHGQTERIHYARFAVVLHRHGERAAHSAHAGEPDSVRRD